MDYRGYVAFFTTILLLASLQIEANDIPKLINQVCQASGLSDIASCEATLRTYPGISAAKDAKSVANIALHVTRQESIRTHDFLTGFAAQPSTNPAYKAPLNECAKYFNDAIADLNLRGLAEGTASLDVHYALDSVEYCENACSTQRIALPAVTGRIQKWKLLFNIAYGAVMLAENESGGAGM